MRFFICSIVRNSAELYPLKGVAFLLLSRGSVMLFIFDSTLLLVVVVLLLLLLLVLMIFYMLNYVLLLLLLIVLLLILMLLIVPARMLMLMLFNVFVVALVVGIGDGATIIDVVCFSCCRLVMMRYVYKHQLACVCVQ